MYPLAGYTGVVMDMVRNHPLTRVPILQYRLRPCGCTLPRRSRGDANSWYLRHLVRVAGRHNRYLGHSLRLFYLPIPVHASLLVLKNFRELVFVHANHDRYEVFAALFAVLATPAHVVFAVA